MYLITLNKNGVEFMLKQFSLRNSKYQTELNMELLFIYYVNLQ